MKIFHKKQQEEYLGTRHCTIELYDWTPQMMVVVSSTTLTWDTGNFGLSRYSEQNLIHSSYVFSEYQTTVLQGLGGLFVNSPPEPLCLLRWFILEILEHCWYLSSVSVHLNHLAHWVELYFLRKSNSFKGMVKNWWKVFLHYENVVDF